MTAPPPAPRRRRCRRRLLLAAAVVPAVGFVSRPAWLPQVAYAVDVSVPPRPCDAVFVLGGGLNDRPFVAAAMYRKGLTRRVLLAPVDPAVASEDVMAGLRPPEHELARRALLARGVPADAITDLPAVVRSTADEAAALGRWLADHPDAGSVAVVTHGFHTRRCRLVFRRAAGPAAAGRLFYVAAPLESCTPTDWWKSDDGVVVYATEYLKLALAGGW